MFRPQSMMLAGGLVVAATAWLAAPDSTPKDCSGGGLACPAPLVPVEAEGSAKMARYDMRARAHSAPPAGGLRKAYEAKQALQTRKADVRGASGEWEQYGQGPLLASGLAHNLDLAPLPRTNLFRYAGRVDDFAYDPVNQRLFVAVGTGGIWMSEATNGDVWTLGNYWVSVGDNLPTQANGGVLWTAGGGGTLVSAGGDSVMSTGAYHGLGAHWTTDLGVTWTRSEGFPDDALVFNTEADPGNPNILYIASSKGLYRSDDAGRSFRNVALPTTPECAGNIDPTSACNLANVVSDVVVKAPGGVGNFSCKNTGCPVLAAVGWRAGAQFYSDGVTPQSPANGLYRSDTGQVGSFERLELAELDKTTGQGFAPQERIGRVEMGVANGPLQDHNYVYAMVGDAVLLQGGNYTADPPLDIILGENPVTTLVNGIYVSSDFGSTWTQMADTLELGTTPGPFAALIPPGVQSWYNQYIKPDPTRQVPGLGIPTRLVYGLEEVFQNPVEVPLDGTLQAFNPNDFQNIGYYFSAEGALNISVHPDQHANIWIPDGLGGVCLFIGHDGGVNRQCTLPGQPLTPQGWSYGENDGFYTLLPYGFDVAKDGTVWWGLQDNGSGFTGADGVSIQAHGGDGVYAAVDPDNSDLSYTESQNGGLRRTTDRGLTSTGIAPPYARVNFVNWFQMDPLDPNHMITTANQVFETLDAPNVTSGTWNEVYRLGVNPRTEVLFTAKVADVHGSAIYVGACGDCGVTTNDTGFQNKLATNIGGSRDPVPGTSQGWHTATAAGLPNRYIGAIEIDPEDPFTVYVGLHGYDSGGLRGPGAFGDQNPVDPQVEAGNLFKSTDAGETFVPIQGSLPVTPIDNILVRDGQLLVATNLGVFISSDLEGSDWAPLGSNLPNVPVTQIKMQPGNPNTLFASTYGRHIWTYTFPADAQMSENPVDARRDRGSAARAAGSSLRGGAAGGLALLVLALLGLRRMRRAH